MVHSGPGTMSEQTILAKALEFTDPAERSRYIARACGDDDPLWRRVLALLDSHELSGTIAAAAAGPSESSHPPSAAPLDFPAGAATTPHEDPLAEKPGSII